MEDTGLNFSNNPKVYLLSILQNTPLILVGGITNFCNTTISVMEGCLLHVFKSQGTHQVLCVEHPLDIGVISSNVTMRESIIISAMSLLFTPKVYASFLQPASFIFVFLTILIMASAKICLILSRKTN